MFTRKEQLIQRTGKNGVGRFDFLKLLVTEFKTTKSRDSKEQVLANLANFAYDPVNYEYLLRLNVIELFLCAISEANQKLVRFAIGGICNLCLDPIHKQYIINNQGVQRVSSLLSSTDEEIVLSAITTLMYLTTPASKEEITSPQIIDCMLGFSKSANKRVKNLAVVFLNDYCQSEQVEKVKQSAQNCPVSEIPIPR